MYVAGLLRREPRIARLVDHHDALRAGHRAVDQRALAGAGHAGDHAEHPERDVDVDVLEVVRRGAADLQRAGRRAHRLLEGRPVVEVAAGRGVTPPQPVHGALEADRAAPGAGARTEVDDVVGDRDGLGLVLDDEHRVALVAQLQQQVVHPLDVVRVQADRGLVEDVGDVGERRAEVADHLGALRLSPGQGARRPVEREVSQADLVERVEEVLQPGEQRADRRLVEVTDPFRQIADLHLTEVGDVLPLDLRGQRFLAQSGAVAVGADR